MSPQRLRNGLSNDDAQIGHGKIAITQLCIVLFCWNVEGWWLKPRTYDWRHARFFGINVLIHFASLLLIIHFSSHASLSFFIATFTTHTFALWLKTDLFHKSFYHKLLVLSAADSLYLDFLCPSILCFSFFI